MMAEAKARRNGVRDDGTSRHRPLTREEAMRPAVRYTTPRRRQLLEALDAGLVSVAEVCAVHGADPKEIDEWRRDVRPTQRRARVDGDSAG